MKKGGTVTSNELNVGKKNNHQYAHDSMKCHVCGETTIINIYVRWELNGKKIKIENFGKRSFTNDV